MKKPTVLPTLEGSEQHLSTVVKIILAVAVILAILTLMSDWNN